MQDQWGPLADALAVVEFVRVFGSIIGFQPVSLQVRYHGLQMMHQCFPHCRLVHGTQQRLTVQSSVNVAQALRAAARWPLDSDVLPQLYLSLLQCLLREQVRHLQQSICNEF